MSKNKRTTRGSKPRPSAKPRRPIAEKLVRRMKNTVRGEVVDLEAFVTGRANAEELQKTVATRDESSFFTCWALFDVCIGLAKETLGTIAVALGAAFGMHDDLLRLMGLLQQSRLGIYVHEGTADEAVVLRELVTDAVCRTIVLCSEASTSPSQHPTSCYVRESASGRPTSAGPLPTPARKRELPVTNTT